mgnify:CR=1 FL=1
MSTFISKLWAVMILALVVIQGIFVGEDIGSNDGKELIVDSILLAFWIAALVWFHLFRIREVRLDIEIENSRKDLDKAMKNLLGEILGGDHKGHEHVVKTGKPENDLHESLSDKLVDIIAEVVKDGSPEPKHFAEIKKRFEAKTGHEVKLKKEGLGLSVQIGKEPIAKKKPATKKAPVKKPVAKAAPTTKKPVTKKGK